jgi:hypothetical protein
MRSIGRAASKSAVFLFLLAMAGHQAICVEKILHTV